MTELNDEALGTYLDGELSAQSRAQIEAALAQDAGARVRLERLRGVDELLRRAIPESSITREDSLARLILSGVPSGTLVSSSPARDAVRRRRTATFVALAAGVSGLAVGVIVPALLRGGSGTTVRLDRVTAGIDIGTLDISTDRAVATALESVESGAHLQSGQRKVSIVLSFRSADGEYCRVFESSGAPAGGEGIACREKGQWRLVAWDGTQQANEGFRPAGGSESIDAAMDRLGGRAAIDPAAERRLIDDQWKE